MKREFDNQRSLLLLRNFRESIAAQSRICAAKTFHEIVNLPAPRFWVSEARAARICSLMRKGHDVTVSMTPEKRDMYREIYRRVEALRAEHPEMSVGDLVFTVVNSEAPRYYLSPKRAEQLIQNAKTSGGGFSFSGGFPLRCNPRLT